jgi:hypothetical protein
LFAVKAIQEAVETAEVAKVAALNACKEAAKVSSTAVCSGVVVM